MMKWKSTRLLEQGYEDLKAYAETGQVSEVKRESPAKYDEKRAQTT